MNALDFKNVTSKVESTMPWINGIESKAQYDELLSLMDSLVEDYDSNQTLINMLWPVLEQYEEESEFFKPFNDHMNSVDRGVAMLNLIIDQNDLKLSELPEVGSKSLVSLILKGKRSITLPHIKALSERFGIPTYMFV